MKRKRLFTPRQLDVVRLMALGMSNPEIGAALGISKNTVRNHIYAMYNTLEVKNRVLAVLAAQDAGVLE